MTIIRKPKKQGLKEYKVNLEDPNLTALGTMEVSIEGLPPGLMQKAWSKKALDMMRAAQEGGAKAKKAPKDPVAEFLDCLHVIGSRPKTEDDLGSTRFGVPAVSFKECFVRGAKACDYAMTDARQAIFVEPTEGELVEILAPIPVIHTGPVRNSGKVADIRHRPLFQEWQTTLKIIFNYRMVSHNELVTWINWAGFGCGVGEWRPGGRQTSGTYGRFKVTAAKAFLPEMAKVA